MSATPTEGIDLRNIIKKTGHQLEEIRLRALENILSKLRNQLICVEDLVNHRELVVNLLQWFNFENVTRVADILSLLEDLSKHGSTATMIHSLGGVEFLSTLRQDLTDKENLEKIDNILNNLFWIHAQDEHGPTPVVDPTVLQDFTAISKEPDKDFQNGGGFRQNAEFNSIQEATTSVRDSSQGADQVASLNGKDIAEPDQRSYYEHEKVHNSVKAEWVVLTSSDRHILSVTESRLQSHSPALVVQSCEFFKDVLLKDFPTHIFIQRPNIVKTLLHLLEVRTGKENNIDGVFLGCLIDLTTNLFRNSLQQRSDDLTELPKANEVSSSTASSAHTETSSLHSRATSFDGRSNSPASHNSIGRGNNADLQSNGESDLEDYESELLTEALQQSQWSSLDFCLNVISGTCSFLIHSFQHSEECEGVILLLIRVFEVLSLFDVSSIWEGPTNNRKVYDVMACLRKITDVVQLCSDAKDNFSQQSENAADTEKAYAILADVTMISVRLLNAAVPLARVYEAVPESLLRCYKQIFTDEIMARSYPYVRGALLGVVKVAEEEFYVKYQQASDVVTSMQATKAFVDEKEKQVGRVDLSMLLDLCENSLLSVGFHSYADFIKNAVLFVAEIYKVKDAQTSLMHRSNRVLLFLISHKNARVQEIAYQTCFEVVTDALSVSHVTEPLSSSYQKAAFIFDPQVLQEIVNFGLNSSSKKVMNYCTNIMVALLLGRLNMSPRLWQALIDHVISLLPILQGFASTDKALQRSLVNLSDSSNALLASDGELYSLPPIEQLRASFRFMFARDSNLRAKGFSSIVWSLTQEDNRNGSSVRYPFESIKDVSDMFIVSPSMSAKHSQETVGHASFSAAQINQLWDVFISSSVDQSLKESAAEQLSILLRDPSWHRELIERDAKYFLIGSLHSMISVIKSFSVSSVEVNCKMLLCHLKMLKFLAIHNAALRHAMAMEKHLYLDIIKTRILCNNNESLHYESSCLLMLLVFDEVARKGEAEPVSVPLTVSKRYLLPYKPEQHHLTTEFRETSKNEYENYSESLSDEALFSMIRINWNIILAGTPEEVKCTQKDGSAESVRFAPSLILADHEAKILRSSLPDKSMQKTFDAVGQTQNTAVAINCINGLRKYVLAYICRGCMEGDAFEDVFTELVDRARLSNVLEKILLSSSERNRTFVLQNIVRFSHFFILANSKSSLEFSLEFLKMVTEQGGLVLEAIADYSLQTAKKTEFPNSPENPYDSKNEKRILFKETLRLINSATLQINSRNIQGKYTDTKGLGNFISILVQSLARVDSTSYYDLPILETTLDCLYHVTYKGGWSSQFRGSGEELCGSMAHALIQILHSFHVDRIGASTTFMGKGVMMKVALCLCHVAKECQTYSQNKDWTASWLNSENTLTNHNADIGLPWLVPLLTDRVLDIRWAGWSLATALLDGDTGAEYVINEFQVYPGGVWASAVGVFLDPHESPIVRCQASGLLSTLLSKLKRSGNNITEDYLWKNMIVQDTNTKANISGFPAFLLLLDHFQFFKKIKDLLRKRPEPRRPISTNTELHNVSTSCSTPASDAAPRYGRMPGDSVREQVERTSSMSGFQSENRSASNERLSNSKGSSTKSLLLGSTGTDVDIMENEEKIYRLSLSESKPIARDTHDPRHLHSPKLLGSLFKLLYLLMKIDAEPVISHLESENLLDEIVRFLDSETFTQYTSKFSKHPLEERRAMQFHEDSRVTKNLLALINLMITSHEITKKKLRNENQFIENILSLFKLPSNLIAVPQNMSQSVLNVWMEALKVVYKLVGDSKTLEKSRLESSIIEQFHLLASACLHAFHHNQPTFGASRLFLVVVKSLLCREARREKTNRCLDNILDSHYALPKNKADELLSKGSTSSVKPADNEITLGESLCDALLRVSDKFPNLGTEKREVFSTLSALFAVSLSSKLFAVKSGFLESVIEDIKDIHVKLNLASLQLERDGNKRKEKPLLLELADYFSTLRNLLYLSQETKVAAIEAGLMKSIQKIWSWCMLDKALKISVLELLMTFTADCKKALEVICYNSTSKKGPADDSSLFPSILKLLIKLHKDSMAPTGKIDSSTCIVFHLMANIATLNDCRTLLWKNNVYQHFASSQVGQNANKKQKVASKILTALWIQLLLVLSFFADGAQALIKVNGLLATIIDFASEEQHRERQKSLLILRNLLFFPVNKPSLLTNNLLVSCLLKALDSKSVWSRAIVVSCFASLLHNCHKICSVKKIKMFVHTHHHIHNSLTAKTKDKKYVVHFQAKVTLKRTKLFGRLQLIQEELLTGKLLSIDGNIQGYEQLKTAVSKTLKLLSD